MLTGRSWLVAVKFQLFSLTGNSQHFKSEVLVKPTVNAQQVINRLAERSAMTGRQPVKCKDWYLNSTKRFTSLAIT
jgi:hypothetical protein